jgi:hypothetical protein
MSPKLINFQAKKKNPLRRNSLSISPMRSPNYHRLSLIDAPANRRQQHLINNRTARS